MRVWAVLGVLQLLLALSAHSLSRDRHPSCRFLKKHNVRDWLRVVASNKDRNAYELRYFKIADAGAEDEDDE